MWPKPFEVISMVPKRMKMIAAILAVVFISGVAFALPDASTVNDVRYTVHNLSNNSDISKGLTGEGRNYTASLTSASSQANQVCIFCHTPHNASAAIPLWNKAYPAGLESGYRLYTSSTTLTDAAKHASITANSESLLCLSCHDGKTAINVLHNVKNPDSSSGANGVVNFDGTFSGAGPFALGQQYSGVFTSINGPNLGAVRSADGSIPSSAASLNGTNLTDDHPIGFSYTAAQAQDVVGLKATPDAGIRLFGPTRRVECSSCHNPHVYYGSGLSGSSRLYFDTDVSAGNTLVATDAQKAKTPFLNISNNGSNLCKGCHIK